MEALVLLALVVSLIALASRRRKYRPEQRRDYSFDPRPILTKNELEFFHRLKSALPEHHIFTQVSLSALLSPQGGRSHKGYYAARAKFSQKYADFVVCAADTLNVLAVVELDDRTHRKDKDEARDAMLGSAGYVTLRFESRNKPSVQELRSLFANAYSAQLRPGSTSQGIRDNYESPQF